MAQLNSIMTPEYYLLIISISLFLCVWSHFSESTPARTYQLSVAMTVSL